MSASLMPFILLPSMFFMFSPVIFFPPHYFEVPGKTVLNHAFIFNMLFLLLYSRIPSFPLLCSKNLMFLIVFMTPALLFLFWDSSLLYASYFQHLYPFPPCSEILKSDYDVFQNRAVCFLMLYNLKTEPYVSLQKMATELQNLYHTFLWFWKVPPVYVPL